MCEADELALNETEAAVVRIAFLNARVLGYGAQVEEIGFQSLS